MATLPQNVATLQKKIIILNKIKTVWAYFKIHNYYKNGNFATNSDDIAEKTIVNLNKIFPAYQTMWAYLIFNGL